MRKSASDLAKNACAIMLAAVAMWGTAQLAYSETRSMETGYRADELTSSDQSLRRLQHDRPQLFEQVLRDINAAANARDPASVQELATATPALEDLQRTSPEALLGLFLLLKGAGKKETLPAQ
jgi:hypothetical protein